MSQHLDGWREEAFKPPLVCLLNMAHLKCYGTSRRPAGLVWSGGSHARSCDGQGTRCHFPTSGASSCAKAAPTFQDYITIMPSLKQTKKKLHNLLSKSKSVFFQPLESSQTSKRPCTKAAYCAFKTPLSLSLQCYTHTVLSTAMVGCHTHHSSATVSASTYSTLLPSTV